MADYCLGDIHGRYSALIDVLDQAEFDYKNDTLVVLGDIVDGGEHTKFVVDELLKISHCIYVVGNHCRWFMDWMATGLELPLWVHQGGLASMRSYNFDWRSIPWSHRTFFENSVPFWIDEKNRLYVHGGFDPKRSIFYHTVQELTWDRNLINYALTRDIPGYSHVFVGHTTTQFIKGTMNHMTPITFHNLTALDTGAGWHGRLSLIDVDTMDIWQSEIQTPNKEKREVYTQWNEDY